MNGRCLAVALLVLVAGAAEAQYTPSGNPYQADLPFALGAPVEIRAEVEGVRLDAFLVANNASRSGDSVECEVVLTGSSVSDRKATLEVAALLEDADGNSLGRVKLESFRVKGGKTFEERQKVNVPAEALGAQKVYLLVKVST